MFRTLLAIVVLTSATLVGPSAYASDPAHANETAWSCFEGEKFYPEGRTVVIRGRTFGYCAGRVHKDVQTGESSLSISEERFVEQSLASEDSDLRYSGNIHANTARNPFMKNPWEHEVARREYGGITYSIQVLPFRVEDAERSLAEGRLPGWGRFYASATADTPAHVISCTVAPIQPLPDDYHCSLYVSYPASESIVIEQVITRHLQSGGGSEFELNDLPHRVRGLVKAYEALDLTDVGE